MSNKNTRQGNCASLKVSCYITRGAHGAEWYLWNTCPDLLTLDIGDVFNVCMVTVGFDEDVKLLRIKAVSKLKIKGLSNMAVIQGQDLTFLKQIEGIDSIVTKAELENMCLSRGLKCSAFLDHVIGQSGDKDTETGSQMMSLFSHTVGEMLERKYDIMHQYPLFIRALTMYFSANPGTETPPSPTDMCAPGGLLDRSSAEHESFHGIPLQAGNPYSKWNYPDKRHAQAIGTTLQAGKIQEQPVEPDGSQEKLEQNTQQLHDENAHLRFLIYTMQKFNTFPGTMTDGPLAFPHIYKMCLNQQVTFDNLVSYCLGHTCEPLGCLPPRENWGSINPVLLMEDPLDPDTGTTARQYTVTSRGHLSTMVMSKKSPPYPCYNEVFLPGRPVSRLNLDVDLKCCQACNERFASKAEMSVRNEVAKALTTSLILVIVESIMRLAKVTRRDLEKDTEIGEFARSVGKLAVYLRASEAKAKLSLRVLWYLPIELCSVHGIDAFRPLLEEMNKVSKQHALLSYPKDTALCGLCDLGQAISKAGKGAAQKRFLKCHSEVCSESRVSSIDRAPYSSKKCVRLPNCYKEHTAFEYVGTFNTHDLQDPEAEDPKSLAVGLSSNPILTDVTSLGARFSQLMELKDTRERLLRYTLPTGLKQDYVQREAQRLASLWGVPVTITNSTSGFHYINATAKSSSYACPLHNRVHSKAKLGAVVLASETKPTCFVPL